MSILTPHRPLAGKVALVTGGSRSIGAAIARRLAKDGAAVALAALVAMRAEGERVAPQSQGSVADFVRQRKACAGFLSFQIRICGLRQDDDDFIFLPVILCHRLHAVWNICDGIGQGNRPAQD